MGIKTRMTKEKLLTIKQYYSDGRNLTQAEIATLTGTSAASVSRAISGDYDFLLTDVTTAPTTDYAAIITASEMEELFAYKRAIMELIESSRLSDKKDNALFFPSNFAQYAIERNLPQLYADRVRYLHNNPDLEP